MENFMNGPSRGPSLKTPMVLHHWRLVLIGVAVTLSACGGLHLVPPPDYVMPSPERDCIDPTVWEQIQGDQVVRAVFDQDGSIYPETAVSWPMLRNYNFNAGFRIGKFFEDSGIPYDGPAVSRQLARRISGQLAEQ